MAKKENFDINVVNSLSAEIQQLNAEISKINNSKSKKIL